MVKKKTIKKKMGRPTLYSDEKLKKAWTLEPQKA